MNSCNERSNKDQWFGGSGEMGGGERDASSSSGSTLG